MKRNFFFFLSLIVMFLLNAHLTFAQCGASLSSCKTCHEVKRAKPVATQGKWHQDHAFGDFCEFCHGGNTAAKDKATAHKGIDHMPLKTPGNTCSSCHPDDYKDRALKYAAILKIDISEETGSAAAPPTEPAPAPAAAQPKPVPTVTSSPGPTVSIPAGGEIVDFNEILSEKETQPLPWGNIILVLLIIGLFIIFLYLYWFFNRAHLKKKIEQIAHEPLEEIPSGETGETQDHLDEAVKILQSRPLIQELVLQLKDRDPVVIESILKITRSDQANERLIKSLSRLDFDLIHDLQEKNERELEVLLTLAKKL